MNQPYLPLPKLAPRWPESHKGDFGRALLVGGSRGMAGSISLAGMAALRGGAGLVTLAVPSMILETVAGFEPSYMTYPLPCDHLGRLARESLSQLASPLAAATCVALGPGLGRAADLDELVAQLYAQVAAPLVCDADALNALASAPRALSQASGPRILTPHPGEFRRLLSSPATNEECVKLAGGWAAQHGVVLVLKGHHTLVTDGTHEYRNGTGNPGMATGGSGDVLTGLITALVCQGLAPFEAAQLGVYVHGLAGNLAAEALGQISLVASDLVRFLPAAFRQLGYP